MVVKIKRHDKDLILPEKIKVGDWVDLRASEDTFVALGNYKQIPLGISMEIPEGCFAMVLPRSSTFKKWGIMMANSMGIIDQSYCGDNDIWQFPTFCVMNTIDTVSDPEHRVGTIIKKNERICQFTLIKKTDFTLKEVEKLGNADRGGFGSTGRD